MKRGRGLVAGLALALTALGHPGAAQAVDGAIEINASRAQAGGINGDPGVDPPGYPVVISQPGSYVLTGNLSVDAKTDAISIVSSDVTIDFHGFGIMGPRAAGTGRGVVSSESRVTVMNGFVRGVGSHGVSLGLDSRVERMMISWCNGDGIVVGSGGQVIANRVTENLGRGLVLHSQAGYVDNIMVANGGDEVVSGHPLGGNLCDQRRCARMPLRGFYLTSGTHNGANAANAGNCASGFHFASLYEMADPTTLEYQATLGRSGGDLGKGPYAASGTAYGWVRTGAPSTAFTGTAGFDNCQIWTNTSGDGSAARLGPGWSDPAAGGSPWEFWLYPCSGSLPVWCVED